jgi:membrane peptidoglycan carboxypeptidase
VTGLRRASAYFFGVAPDDLRPQQSAALIAMMRSPIAYSPYCARERFAQRYLRVVETIGERGAAWSADSALARLRPRECPSR